MGFSMTRQQVFFAAAVSCSAAAARHSRCVQRAAAHVQRACEGNLSALSSALQHHHLHTPPQLLEGVSERQQRSLAEQALLLAAGLAAAVSLHLGNAHAAEALELDLASVAEDSLLQLVQRVEISVGSAVDAVRSAVSGGGGGGSAAAAQEARDLIHEVWEVVDSNFTDVRHDAFDHERWRQLRDQALRRPLGSKAAAYSAIREMLAQLNDPYSRFISPAEFSSMMKYDVSGVGLNLGTAEEFVNKTGLPLPEDRSISSGGTWVVGLIKGAPADAAGLRQGDELLGIDGQPLGERSPFEVASLLQGQPEEAAAAAAAAQGNSLQASPVSVSVRHLDGSTESLTLSRPVRVVRSPVTSRLEPAAGSTSASGGPVGYIQLSSFNARAQRDTLAAVRALEAQGAKRLVLDLRDNRGGLVTEGIEVAKLFLEDDALVVNTEGKARASSTPITAPGPAATRAPLVVLVNDHTASASEILAGALRDNCRAVLVGSRTYGKGLIQSVYELHDGSGMALTVGKYVSPNGTDIDREGLRPDFRSLPSPEAAAQAVQACKLERAAASSSGSSGMLN